MKRIVSGCYLAIGLLAGRVAVGQAQTSAGASPAAEPVYEFVEQMPALLDGKAVWEARKMMQQTMMLPAEVKTGKTDGKVEVTFVIGADGKIRDAKVTRSLSPATDAAALAAIRELPLFQPGKQNGRPVAVRLRMPIEFFGPNHVFRYAALNPVVRTGDFNAYQRQHLRLPAVVTAEQLSGTVGVSFVVLPNGRIDSVRLAKPLMCASCDAEALRFVRALPPCYPGRNEAGQPVAVQRFLTITMPPPPAPPTPDSVTRPYTYVEQMPSLPGGGGAVALAAAIQKNYISPANHAAEECGKVSVKFKVGPRGGLYDIEIERGCSVEAANAAAVAAVRKLGRLVPGQQNGYPVTVQLSVPVVAGQP